MNLKTLNLIACAVHYGLALFCILYFSNLNKTHPNAYIKGIELSIRDHKLAVTDIPSQCVSSVNTYCNNDGTGYSVQLNSVGISTPSIQTIQTMLISFFIITGTFHLYYYLGNNEIETEKSRFSSHYTYMIRNKNNYFRWIEYAITSTLMLYIIALMSNVKETNVYLLLYATNVVMIAMGQLIEVAVRDGTDWITPMISGFVLLFAEFSIIFRSFWGRLDEVNAYSNTSTRPNKPRLPNWAQAMIILLFLFYSSFGMLSLIGAWSGMNYERVEQIYIILSLCSKTTLGLFIIYANSTLQQNGWAGTS